MKTCSECRHFSPDPGVDASGALDIGLCRYGDFLVAPGERACGARTLSAGEAVQLRAGGFGVVAEHQPAGASHVMIQRLHTTQAVPRYLIITLDNEEEKP